MPLRYDYLPAQPQSDFDPVEFMEEITALQDDDIDYEALYETLLIFYGSPLDLNEATKAELGSLYILSEMQLNAFFQYRDGNGPLLSTLELQAIPGFDLHIIRRLLPFVKVKPLSPRHKGLQKPLAGQPNNYLLMRYQSLLERKRGFRNGDPVAGFLGDPHKFYTRLRLAESGDFALGVTAEKDEGEAFRINLPQKVYGFDYYSYYLQLQQRGPLKNLILGDYQAQFGQGLITGAGFVLGKGSEPITTLRRGNLGLRPYTSAVESGFFRGVGATFQVYKNIQLTAFYSGIHQDALVKNDSSLSVLPFVSAIRTDGNHRTRSELQAKDQLNEKNIGSNLLFVSKQKNLQWGITYLQTRYSLPLIKIPSTYNRFHFQGKTNHAIGSSLHYENTNFSWFGEIARSASGGWGAVVGMLTSVSTHLELGILLRNYGRDFHSFYGNSFGERSVNRNERGVYWGMKYKKNNYTLTAYFDKFSFPWLHNRSDAPSEGFEYLFKAHYAISALASVYGQFREENKPRNMRGEDDPMNRQWPGIKRNFLLNLDIQAGESVSLRSRCQWSSYRLFNNLTHGFALSQDFNFHFSPFKLSTRLVLFETEDFDNRQYIFEKDVLYMFSIPALQGQGMRYYLLLENRFNRKITFWIKLSSTKFRDRDQIGSGWDTIDGDRRTELKFQTRIKLFTNT